MKKGTQKYWMESCSPDMRNIFRGKWETRDTYEKRKRTNRAESFACEIGILSTEDTSSNPKIYAAFVKHNATHAWQRKIHFPIEQLNVDELNCFYNQTHINAIMKTF